jgi:capsular polysaccharide biosynthesis protein
VRPSTLPNDRETGMFRLYACVMIITTGLAVGVALLGTQTPPQYSASAEILIGPTITPSGNYIQPSMPTEQRVATSADVVNTAAAKLGVTSTQALEHLSVTVPVDTELLVMSYSAETPGAALSGATAFAQTYLRARNPQDGKDVVATQVSPPALPSTPLAPNYPVILGAAVFAGLLTGFGLARAWDRVRGRIRTAADAERCADLDALALTPRLPRASKVGYQRVLAGRSQLDPLAARVLGQVEGGSQSSVLVTGAGTNCGSTAVAALTAIALARMGRVVILVTADHEVVARLSRERAPQRGPRRTTRDPWPDAKGAEQEGLHLVSVAEWDGAGVAATKVTNLLTDLHRRHPEALIVIDGPPAWCSAGIALRVDKILLVVELGRSSRKATAIAVQALDHCAEKMMGLVITPRRGHTRRGLASVGAWASRQARRVMFRIAPPEVDPSSTYHVDLKTPRPSAAESARTDDVKPLRKPRPSAQPASSDEPTSSVLS